MFAMGVWRTRGPSTSRCRKGACIDHPSPFRLHPKPTHRPGPSQMAKGGKVLIFPLTCCDWPKRRTSNSRCRMGHGLTTPAPSLVLHWLHLFHSLLLWCFADHILLTLLFLWCFTGYISLTSFSGASLATFNSLSSLSGASLVTFYSLSSFSGASLATCYCD